jgi:hypothetical protein
VINFDLITDGIFVGTCPASTVDVQRLKQAGITAILNMQTDRDFNVNGINWPMLEKNYHQSGISSYRYPIIDFDDDDMLSLIGGAAKLLDEITKNHPRIYVHCTAGQQRSPSAVITWLAWQKNHALENAINIVMKARKCDPPLHVLRKADDLLEQSKHKP